MKRRKSHDRGVVSVWRVEGSDTWTKNRRMYSWYPKIKTKQNKIKKVVEMRILWERQYAQEYTYPLSIRILIFSGWVWLPLVIMW